MRIAIAGATGVVGRHVLEVAHQRGHETAAISRSAGIDVSTGDGLAAALDGADVIIDVLNAPRIEEEPATEFFRSAAAHLQRCGAERGVHRLLTLSVVGVDRPVSGYFAAKLAHERAAAEGPVPQTTLRATQFHEFAAQQLAMMRDGDRAYVFDVTVQTVAARAVGETLVEIAERGDAVPELAGPERAELIDLASAYAARYAPELTVVPDTETMGQAARDALLPHAGARVAGPTFAQWLESADAADLRP
jgi:uncharacterized protein YbjT (DUF2867 family)